MNEEIKQLIEKYKKQIEDFNEGHRNQPVAREVGKSVSLELIISDLEQLLSEPKGLPKSWGVLNDGSQLFKDTVIKHINEKDPFVKANLEYAYDGASKGFVYGLTLKGEYSAKELPKPIFDTILTIEQFIALTK